MEVCTMTRQRKPETYQGIVGESIVRDYDEMQRGLRDRGLLQIEEIIGLGITGGTVLEIGPGPGYLGLEWLKRTLGSRLFWLEISEDMKRLAEENAETYGLKEGILMTIGDATKKIPFDDDYFDGIFTDGSMHEWSDPLTVFNEIERVLKPNASFFVGDLKRNTNPLVAFMMETKANKVMKAGLRSSIDAAYTKNEVISLLKSSNIKDFTVRENPFGLSIRGKKVG
jgi:ubiquinone/menaquinone biosynthesis C-methylase UbiE